MLLIKTPLDKNYSNNSDKVLLGEWCRLYGRDDPEYDSIETVPYHWDDRGKLESDFYYLQDLNERVLHELSTELNQLHGIKRSAEYWRLLVGYWLTQFTTVAFDRWENLRLAKETYGELVTPVSPLYDSLLAPNDTPDAGQLFLQDEWNQQFYDALTGEFNAITPIPRNTDLSRNTGIRFGKVDGDSHGKAKLTLMDKFRRTIAYKKIGLKTRLKVPSSSQYALFVKAGIPSSQIRLLEADSGKVRPVTAAFPEVPRYPFDLDKRTWELPLDATTAFESFLRWITPKCIPRVFIEGYTQAREEVATLRVTKNLKTVFTTNVHFSHDIFKIWFGETRHRRSSVRLVVGQHGGGAFHRFNGATSYELSVADVYAAHGYGETSHPRVVAVGRFNNKVERDTWDFGGYMLLTTGAMPRYVFDVRSMPMAGQMIDYFEDQFRFYERLNEGIRKEVRLRLYPKGDYGWNQKQRWLDRYPGIAFDNAEKSMSEMVKGCRLFVGTYNATTYNETLAANIPTVCYWDPNLWEISDTAAPFFDALHRVGIMHDTPDTAAAHINKHWEDIAEWWNSPDVQRVRNDYCYNFALLDGGEIDRLLTVL